MAARRGRFPLGLVVARAARHRRTGDDVLGGDGWSGTNQAARDALADAYVQLGYQAEAGTWRNIYLVRRRAGVATDRVGRRSPPARATRRCTARSPR